MDRSLFPKILSYLTEIFHIPTIRACAAFGLFSKDEANEHFHRCCVEFEDTALPSPAGVDGAGVCFEWLYLIMRACKEKKYVVDMRWFKHHETMEMEIWSHILSLNGHNEIFLSRKLNAVVWSMHCVKCSNRGTTKSTKTKPFHQSGVLFDRPRQMLCGHYARIIPMMKVCEFRPANESELEATIAYMVEYLPAYVGDFSQLSTVLGTYGLCGVGIFQYLYGDKILQDILERCLRTKIQRQQWLFEG